MRAWSLLALSLIASCGATGGGGIVSPGTVLGTSSVSIPNSNGFPSDNLVSDDVGNLSFGLLLNDERGQVQRSR